MPKVKIESAELKLDIGCGNFKKEGYIGFDKLDFGQEIVWDINNGIPVPDDSVIRINSTHFIEHLNSAEVYLFIKELVRVCKKDAEIYIRCPVDTHISSLYLCHHSLWNEQKFKAVADDEEKLELISTESSESEVWVTFKVIK